MHGGGGNLWHGDPVRETGSKFKKATSKAWVKAFRGDKQTVTIHALRVGLADGTRKWYLRTSLCNSDGKSKKSSTCDYFPQKKPTSSRVPWTMTSQGVTRRRFPYGILPIKKFNQEERTL